MGLRIGFANKYYTLWEYNVSYRTNEKGISFKTESYRFLHNASKDKDRAFTKYPDAIFDENLKGRHHSWSYEKRMIDYNKYHCGKYMGIMFAASTDYDYMMWFYNNCAIDEQKEIIEPILLEEGYEIDIYTYNTEGAVNDPLNIVTERIFISPKEVAKRKHLEEIGSKGKSKLAQGIPFVVTFTRSLNEVGEYFVNDLQITVRFDEYKTMYYDGYYYALPIDVKGKSKRIKNKQIMIEKYDLINENTALVKSWKFV